MSANPIILRRATPGDARIIAGLHTASWQTAYRHILPEEYLAVQAPREHLALWQSYLARPEAMWGLVEVAEMQGNPIGFVSAEKLPNPAYGVLLDCLHVLAPFQGHGAGKLLIDAARAWARQLGEKQMHLYTLEGNARAIAFYERNGWQRAGSVDGYIGETPVTDRRYVIAP